MFNSEPDNPCSFAFLHTVYATEYLNFCREWQVFTYLRIDSINRLKSIISVD